MIQKSKLLIAGFSIIAIIFLTSLKPESSDNKGYDTNLQIINSKNKQIHNFKIKIAKNEEDRRRGLMYIDYLPENYAMLFEFENEQQIFMWMKNTKIPLDMLFISSSGLITNIKHMARPESLDIIPSGEKVSKVLEINGGLCKNFNINVGDYIRY